MDFITKDRHLMLLLGIYMNKKKQKFCKSNDMWI